MKILQITPQAPAQYGGGGIGIIQTICSISVGNEVDYVGPEIEDKSFEKFYKNLYYLESNSNKFSRIFDSLRGNTNARYRSWKKWAVEHDINQYDAVVMDFTKLSYCLADIKNTPLYVRVHNIEYDYAKKDLISDKSIEKFILYIFTKHHEQQIVKRANKLVTITDEDTRRLLELYGNENASKIQTVPVCVDAVQEYQYKKMSKPIELLITGSLWFGSNYQGVKWVLDKVVPIIKVPYHLTIAGARPNRDLKDRVSDMESIDIVDTPESMMPYFNQTDMVLVPVFDGAGMKVKVAEALSYGKAVVATSHALTGYKLEDGVNVFRCDDAIAFAETINSYYHYSEEQKNIFSHKSYEAFSGNYSMNNSIKSWGGMLREISKGM